MEQEIREAEPGTVAEDLAQIADELLEHTRALRRQHEELRDALAGVAPVPASEPVPEWEPPEDYEDEDRRGVLDSRHAMALQMALAGESREAVKEQLRTLDPDGDDEIVDEVFDGIEERRSAGRRRLFTRRSH